MSRFDEKLTVIGFNQDQYELSQCKMEIHKRTIYTKDTSIEIKNGYRIIYELKTGYLERYLVIHICKKASLRGITAIHVMRF